MGRNAVIEILHSGTIKKVIDIASIVGLFMIGCLSASYVKVSTIIQYESNSQMVALQDTLDGILPEAASVLRSNGYVPVYYKTRT